MVDFRSAKDRADQGWKRVAAQVAYSVQPRPDILNPMAILSLRLHRWLAVAALIFSLAGVVVGSEVGLHAAPRASNAMHGARAVAPRVPGPTIEPFVRPDLAVRMERLRPLILAAARRHNRPAYSGMSDHEFAAVIAVILYNENFGWLEDEVAPLRAVTPLYQDLQRHANTYLPGSNFSVWPANLRPSVALEILRHQLPLDTTEVITVPVEVAGSKIDLTSFQSTPELFAAISAEISRDDMAVAYLAANLERGLYRAKIEEVPVSWRTLAAWHNQGLVDPRQIRTNPTARDYLRRASAYLPLARTLVHPPPPQAPQVQGI